MQIRLTRKFAEAIDGVDLSRRAVGDVFNLSRHDAQLLVAEGWASPADLDVERATHRHDAHRHVAHTADASRRPQKRLTHPKGAGRQHD
jgi:RNA-binding protein YlmH